MLGFEVVTRLDRPPAVFLTLGVQHHDIALFQVGAGADDPKDNQVGLHHLALQLDDAGALREGYDTLRRHGVDVIRSADHGTTHSIYFRDPAGNRLELYCDIRDDGLEYARRRTIRAAEDFPELDLDH